MDPYAAIVEIAQEELELVRAGRFDALAELDRRRAVAMAALPAVAPQSAAPALRRAIELQDQITEALTVATAAARHALHRIDAGRNAVHGYRMSTGAQAVSAHADYRS